MMEFLIPVLVLVLVIILVKNKKRKSSNSSAVTGKSVKVYKTTPHARFMTVTSDGYCGTYNLNSNGCFVYGPNSAVLIDVKESVYDLWRDPSDNKLIASCEESNGKIYDGEDGQSIGSGGAHSTIATRRVLGKRVTVSAHWNNKDYRVQVQGQSTQRLSHSGQRFFIRDLIEHNGRAIVLAFNYDSELGGFWRSDKNKLTGWSWVPVKGMANKRPMKALPYRDGIAITYSTYRHGKRAVPGGVGLFQNGVFTVLHSTDLSQIGMGISVAGNDLYYSTLTAWRGKGQSAIFTNQSGVWRMLVSLERAECWDLAFTNKGSLLAATGQEGSNGVVYEIF